MNITVIGAGYVGLVTGACFAELGNHVTCVDVNQEKIAHLRQGILPIYEPGLEAMVLANQQEGRLHFIDNLANALADTQVIFIAVGTPSDKEGHANTAKLMEVTIETPTTYVGRTTRDSIQVGLYFGQLGGLKELLAGTKQEIFPDEEMVVIGTGGFARLFKDKSLFDALMPDLVLEGLWQASLMQ